MRSPILLAFAGLSAAQSLVSVLESQSDLSTLLSALQAIPDLTSVVAAASNITILAPTNDAFAALSNTSIEAQAIANNDTASIEAIIAYHVLGGSYPASAAVSTPTYVHTFLNSSFDLAGTSVSNVTGGQNVGLINSTGSVEILSGELQMATVTEANIMAGSIIIHKIDTVLTIPRNVSSTASGLGLSAIVGAIVETDLTTLLDTVGDLTIFVPNNAAFQAAGSAFTGASPDVLRSVLEYHAYVGGVVFSTDVTNTSVTSVQGNQLELSVVNGTVFVDSARVVIPNILLSNGVAHVIDTVLNPSAASVDRSSLTPSATPTPAYSGASSLTYVPFTSAAPSASTISVPTEAMTGASAMATSTTTGAAAPMATAAKAAIGAGAVVLGAMVVAL